MPQHDTNSQYLGKLHNVIKVYQQGSVQVEALRKINLVLQRQKFSFIVGPSGSGKTTLLNLLGCIDVPTSGSFTLLDSNYSAKSIQNA
jgi:putative ABC transport system ATP-binding protein